MSIELYQCLFGYVRISAYFSKIVLLCNYIAIITLIAAVFPFMVPVCFLAQAPWRETCQPLCHTVSTAHLCSIPLATYRDQTMTCFHTIVEWSSHQPMVINPVLCFKRERIVKLLWCVKRINSLNWNSQDQMAHAKVEHTGNRRNFKQSTPMFFKIHEHIALINNLQLLQKGSKWKQSY